MQLDEHIKDSIESVTGKSKLFTAKAYLGQIVQRIQELDGYLSSPMYPISELESAVEFAAASLHYAAQVTCGIMGITLEEATTKMAKARDEAIQAQEEAEANAETLGNYM